MIDIIYHDGASAAPDQAAQSGGNIGGLMAQAQQSMHLAHNFQTELIQAEMREDESEKAELSLLMVHGQDHLMDGMVVYDLASEIIEILRERKL